MTTKGHEVILGLTWQEAAIKMEEHLTALKKKPVQNGWSTNNWEWNWNALQSGIAHAKKWIPQFEKAGLVFDIEYCPHYNKATFNGHREGISIRGELSSEWWRLLAKTEAGGYARPRGIHSEEKMLKFIQEYITPTLRTLDKPLGWEPYQVIIRKNGTTDNSIIRLAKAVRFVGLDGEYSVSEEALTKPEVDVWCLFRCTTNTNGWVNIMSDGEGWYPAVFYSKRIDGKYTQAARRTKTVSCTLNERDRDLIRIELARYSKEVTSGG